MKRRRHVVIKGSSLPVLRIVVRDGNLQSLRPDLADTIDNARPLLAEAIAVLDLRERDEAGGNDAADIVDAVRATDIRLAAVHVGERTDRGSLARHGLPVIEAPLSVRDRAGPAPVEEPAAADEPETAATGREDAAGGPETEAHDAASASGEPSMQQSVAAPGVQQAPDEPAQPDLGPAFLTRPLRSGQRFYAQGRDVVVAAPTSRGSELIADGSVYAFGPLRGRVLAGASGNTSACIVASQLDAELVAVAGVYRIFEADDLKAFAGGPVSVALSLDADGSERLTLAPFAASSYVQRR
jgi:septum site-determining protein MinC